MTTPAGDPEQTLRVDSGAVFTARAASEGQFAPGTIVAGRYRIASLLGSGGMGEVYRAEDTKLGQTVALKFLPARLARDPLLLGRLHEEVRLGRQVAHPNVCRIYDIGEADGAHFVAMEYVDGEDLSRLLKRIGRLAHDKAVDIARGIAAGLAAAHGKGILHRDLKPANIMIDSRGDARIMDFGLALGTGDTDGTISGTPAYMAPEQVAGEPATVQSDVYALGLVMYELFTGKRAHHARTLNERVRDITSDITTPSALIREIDPAVERIILRCLANDPSQRPHSAREVITALPGDDPLQAALAAGETPSPRIVAAAGTEGSLGRVAAWGVLAVVLGSLAFVVAGKRLFGVSAYAQLGKSPAVLVERTETTLRTLGIPAQPFTTFGYDLQSEYLAWLLTDRSRPLPDRLRNAPPLITFRTIEGARPQPPGAEEVMQRPGTTVTHVDGEGRLFSLTAVPAGPWPERPLTWKPLLAAADLDPRTLTPAKTRLVPATGSDVHVAWSGLARDGTTPIHVEAAAWRGTPVFLRISGPWEKASPDAIPFAGRNVQIVAATVFSSVIFIGLLLAWRNVRLRRGDRGSAIRAAGLILVLELVAGLLGAHHQPSGLYEVGLLRRVLADALFWSGLACLLYLALEPYVRRRWPELLISSTRLLNGNYRDPMVGRDVLMGLVAGLVHTALIVAALWLASSRGGATLPVTGNLLALNGARFGAAQIAAACASGAIQGFVIVVVLATLGMLLRRRLLAALTTGLLFLAAYYAVGAGITVWNVTMTAVLVAIVARYGLIAAMVAQASFHAIFEYPLFTTTDWHSIALLPVLLVAALAIWAFRTSLGAQSAFGAVAFDE